MIYSKIEKNQLLKQVLKRNETFQKFKNKLNKYLKVKYLVLFLILAILKAYIRHSSHILDMQYLGLEINDLESLGAIHTAREISQQPQVWLKIWNLLKNQQNELHSFMQDHQYDKIILAGAGTSAYIGESLIGTFHRNLHHPVDAIPTTHLVSHPYDYLSKDETILLISFARSGNSPESKAAVRLADSISKKCHHLIITCNPDGDLAQYQSKNASYVLLLPEETNDRSLAMTSSYSSMLLAGLLISRLDALDELQKEVALASRYATAILSDQLNLIKEIASLPFKRAVFLGSGALYGTATECHLKLQELTDGGIVCKEESFLGFRHGPKAVVNQDTLIVYLLSNNSYASKYEHDLIFAMEKGKRALAQVAIAERLDFDIPVDYKICHTHNGQQLDEDFLTLPGVLPGQLLGFFKSLSEGLMPDQPSTSGAISRVVQGVNIYDLP